MQRRMIILSSHQTLMKQRERNGLQRDNSTENMVHLFQMSDKAVGDVTHDEDGTGTSSCLFSSFTFSATPVDLVAATSRLSSSLGKELFVSLKRR